MIAGADIGVLFSQVLNDSTGEQLTATQKIDISLKDLSASGAVNITATSIDLTYDITYKSFVIANGDLSSSTLAGHSYVGHIADDGTGSMRTIPIYIEVENEGSAEVALSTQGKADVNAEMVDVMGVDTISELSSGAPATNPTFKEAVMFLYMALRNEASSTATLTTVKNNAGSTITQATISESSSSVTRSKFTAP